MPRYARLVLIACTILGVAACGTTPTTVAITPRAVVHKHATLTPAQAKKAAAAAVLVAADLPGYAVKAEKDGPAGPHDQQYESCIGQPAVKYVVSNPGRSFTKGSLVLFSSVDVAPSPSLAMGELEALTGSHGQDCFAAAFAQTFVDEGMRVTFLTNATYPIELPGTDAGFAVSYVVNLERQASVGQVRGVFAGALIGQVEVGIAAIATQDAPISTEQIEALLKMACARVQNAV